MAPAGTLWTVPYQYTGKVIRSVAALGSIEIALPENYEHHVDNLKPEFRSKFPHGKIPSYEAADGFKLFEGYAIARYLASLSPNTGLLGDTAEDAALIHQWVHVVDTELDSTFNYIRQICLGVIPYNKGLHNTLTERQNRVLDTLEAHLLKHTFFVGERLTLADLWAAAILQKGVKLTIDEPLRKKYINLIRHFETVTNQPKLKEIFGDTEYTEKALQFTPPAKEKK